MTTSHPQRRHGWAPASAHCINNAGNSEFAHDEFLKWHIRRFSREQTDKRTAQFQQSNPSVLRVK